MKARRSFSFMHRIDVMIRSGFLCVRVHTMTQWPIHLETKKESVLDR